MTNNIKICTKCLRQVGRCKCYGRTAIVSSLLLKILRILKAKGWVVERWNIADEPIEVAKQNLLHHFLVRLWFFMFAPPPMNGFHQRVNPEFVSSRPTIVSNGNGEEDALLFMYNWAQAIPSFTVPFGQGLCDKCVSQGADWYFSRVSCPAPNHLTNIARPIIFVNKPTRFIEFADEPPQNCVYLVEQKITMPDRIAEMETKGYFKKNPIARRMCKKWAKMKT